MWGSGEMRARCDPLLVGLESKAELLVEDPQVSVATTSHRLRRNLLHLVRHDTDIGLLAVVVAETIEVQAIGKPPEQHDVVLQGDVGPASASTATTPSAAATRTPATGADARTPATGADARTTATAAGHPRSSPASAHALAAAIGLRAGLGSRLHIGECRVARCARLCGRLLRRLLSGLLAAAGPFGARWTGLCSWFLCRLLSALLAVAGPVARLGRRPFAAFAGAHSGPVACARPVTISSARPIPRAGALASARATTRVAPGGINHHLAVLASEVLARTLASLNIVLGEFLPHIGVFVLDAVSMVRVVLPLVEIVDVAAIYNVDDNVAIGDVDVAAAPVAVAPDSMTDCEGAAERDPGGNRTPCIIPRWRRKVVRRIIRIRPGTVNDRWIVVRHIHLGGRGRLDDDVLGRRLSFLCLAPACLSRGRALDRGGLLLVRLQLAVGLRASTQSLDRIHNLRLLRQHGV